MPPSPGRPEVTVAEIGEFPLIERLRRLVPASGPGVVVGIGDDAAVVELSGQALATCDVQVEGVHFTREMCTPRDIGWRALAVNLSDIAAMGGTPRYALVSLLLLPEMPVGILDGVYAGMAEIASSHGVAVVGGNISRTSGPLAIDVTLLGDGRRILRRDGARPGDEVWLTGTVGKAAAGLFLLRHPEVRVPGAETLTGAYCRPVPRVGPGQALAAAGTVTAMIDTSDGTANDLLHVADASGVGVRLDLERLPVDPGAVAAARAAGRDPMAWALGGGEDYELLFTARPEFEASAAALGRAAGVPLTRIGEILRQEDGRWMAGRDGTRTRLVPAGWDHFRSAGGGA
jgi:thiamine-monophosphate kinase